MADVVGRGAELALLSSVLDRALAGTAGLHVVGEPGVGKTSLLRAAASSARERGYATLVAAGGSDEGDVPYGVLGDLVAGAPPVDLPGVARATLDALAGGAAVEPRAVTASVTALLAGIATPIALVVDDLQWADAESRTALERALRRAEGLRLAVVTAARPGAGDEPLPLGLLAGGDLVTEVRLDGLDVAATAALVERRLGTRVSRPTAEALHAATLGNPLLTLEVARLMASGETGVLSETSVPVPERLARMLRTRVAALPPIAREVVEVVALAGRADTALLSAVLGDAAPALDAAREQGLVEVERGRLRLFHPLARAAVVASLDDATARRWHGALAEHVTDPLERARHLVGAAGTPSEDLAGAVAAAADDALRRGAPSAAARAYEQAAALSPDPSPAAVRRARAGEAWHAAGDSARAVEVLRTAASSAPPEVVSDVRAALGRVLGECDGAAAAAGELRAAVDAAVTPAQRAAALRDLAAYVRHTDGPGAGLAAAREALATAEEAGDEDLLLSCLATASLLEFTYVGTETPDLLARAVALERRRGIRRGMASPRTVAIFQAFWSGRAGDARDDAEALLAELPASRPAESVYALYFLALSSWRLGRFAEARDAADRLLDIAEQCGWHDAGWLAWARSLPAAGLGEHADALRWAALARERAEASGEPLWAEHAAGVEGFVALTEGDLALAAERLARANDYPGPEGPGRRLALPDLVEALCGLGLADEAEAALVPFEEAVLRSGGPAPRAVAARCRALVLAARGDPEGAIEVLSACGPSPEAMQVARNDLVLGTLLRRARRRREAAEVLGRAREAFAAIGARAWEAKAAAEVARLGRRTETPVELTPTEEAVGRLVAAGRTNKEVARELSLSVKTVEWNLTRVYRKLGVTSRAALAARAGELLKSGDSPGP